MLTIERRTVQKKIKIGDLAHAVNIISQALDADGDKVLDVKRLGIKVLAPNLVGHFDEKHYVAVKAIRETRVEQVWELETCVGKKLSAADKHLVHARVDGNRLAQWVHMDQLKIGDEINVHVRDPLAGKSDGFEPIIKIGPVEGRREHLYDLQVETIPDWSQLSEVRNDDFKLYTNSVDPVTNAYYTDDIVSHNSHMLVQLGAAACTNKLNVNHYTFELSETAVGLRYDSHFTGIPSNEIPVHREEVLRIEDSMKMGRLIIKCWPTGSATVQTIRSHIERTTLQNHKPDLIIIDYADIMRSTKHYEALRFELKLIYEELRNLAMDLDLPIWTASQSNKDGANSELIGLENMSEAYGKAMVADVVIGLSRKPAEKALGTGRMFIAKNRAGHDGIVYPIRINTAISMISVSEGADALSVLEAQQGDENDMKDIMRKKWSEIKRDKSIQTEAVWHPTKST